MIWKTKDGRKLNIKNMKTSHIINCINMLRRQLWTIPYPKFKGEMAQDCAEKEYRVLTCGLEEIIYNFELELHNRGVKYA